eukprot:13673294-Alexandrium_andersonii.AAC.1
MSHRRSALSIGDHSNGLRSSFCRARQRSCNRTAALKTLATQMHAARQACAPTLAPPLQTHASTMEQHQGCTAQPYLSRH